jgi:ATP-dependent DNA helicase DinG
MAAAVDQAIYDQSTLVVEAGTGVGKTFAYLIPAMLSNKKVIISTGTRHLQDQLFYTDLPVLLDALALPLHAAMLKGRANYLCHYRFKRFEHELHDFQNLSDDYIEVKDWASVTKTGDIAEVNQLSEQSAIWPHVTSTRDNCLGGECPDYKQCHLLQARKNAQEAKLVVINHHLLCADLVLKEEGFGEILPTADVFVLDEAHQLAEILPSFFGASLSSRQIQDLIGDISKEAAQIDSANGALSKVYYAALDAETKFFTALSKSIKEARLVWHKAYDNKTISIAFEELKAFLLKLEEKLMPVAAETPGLAQCYKRLSSLNGVIDEFGTLSNRYVQWVELGRRHFKMSSVPLNAAIPFQKSTQQYECAWIYTSATLTAKQSFKHFTDQLGLEDAECIMCDSPYDYAKQARLYLPSLSRQPNAEGYTDEVIEHALPLLKASHGNAFLLFTSHRALNYAAEIFKSNKDFQVLVQGMAAKRELLNKFQKTENCVLLGTQSFWEGVDVKGQRLRLVIIDKLPFASPSDPLLQARSRALEEAGENPFMAYQVPLAILSLKQGVGRLIRGEHDRGVVVLMDPRIKTKPYGKSFIKSLPAMKICLDPSEIIPFLEEIHSHETARH